MLFEEMIRRLQFVEEELNELSAAIEGSSLLAGEMKKLLNARAYVAEVKLEFKKLKGVWK